MCSRGADDEVVKALESLTGPSAAAINNEQLVPSGQRRCPICGNVMAVETNDGISIDVCAAHGVWLDNGELPRLLQAAKGEVQAKVMSAISRARADGHISYGLLGVWSMLLPEKHGSHYYWQGWKP